MKPNDIDTSVGFFKSVWKKFEAEEVARNVVKLYQREGEWGWISEQEYIESYGKDDWFDEVVNEYYFGRVGDSYFPNKNFLRAIEPYQKGKNSESIRIARYISAVADEIANRMGVV